MEEDNRAELLFQIAAYISELSPSEKMSASDMIDFVSRFLFPTAYIIFSISYWAYYNEYEVELQRYNWATLWPSDATTNWHCRRPTLLQLTFSRSDATTDWRYPRRIFAFVGFSFSWQMASQTEHLLFDRYADLDAVYVADLPAASVCHDSDNAF